MKDLRDISEVLNGLEEQLRASNSDLSKAVLSKMIETLNALPTYKLSDTEYMLEGVMHSVDKWLEGDELKQDECNRAITMRDKVLRIIEGLESKIARYERISHPTAASGFSVEGGKIVFSTNMLNGYKETYDTMEAVCKILNQQLHEMYKQDELIAHLKAKIESLQKTFVE